MTIKIDELEITEITLPETNRRKSARQAACVPIKVRSDKMHNALEFESHNISKTGIGIVTDYSVATNQDVTIEITENTKLQGKVVQSNKVGAGRYLTGIKFKR